MSGTARRLLASFTLLLVVFCASAAAALWGLVEIHEALHSVQREEERVHAALALAAAVREASAQRAHALLLEDAAHLGRYDAAHREVLHLLDALGQHVRGADERARLERLRAAHDRLDAQLRTTLLPVARTTDRAALRREHARLLEQEDAVRREADALAASAGPSLGDFDAHAGAVQHASVAWTLALLLAAALLAVGVGLYIGRSVARPVARLEAGAAQLAAGNLDARIELDRSDEFGRLARQFNAMARALKEDQERLVQSEKLAGVGRLAAGVAHEINNPLGVILGYVRLLQGKAAPDLQDDLRVVEDEALRARDIVRALLSLARTHKEEATDTVLLGAEASEVVERLRRVAAAPLAPVRVAGEARVTGSRPRLQQVLTNLLSNALEAAGPTGEVEVRIQEGTAAVTLCVHDSGPGLSPEAFQHLFEPFFTTKASGVGLGLALSRAIVQAHGGELCARNHPAGGAELTLSLPRGG